MASVTPDGRTAPGEDTSYPSATHLGGAPPGPPHRWRRRRHTGWISAERPQAGSPPPGGYGKPGIGKPRTDRQGVRAETYGEGWKPWKSRVASAGGTNSARSLAAGEWPRSTWPRTR